MLMSFRSKLLLDFIKAGIPFFLCEADAVWLKDPTPYLMAPEHADYDLSIMNDRDLKSKQNANGGFLYIRPSKESLAFWQELENHFLKVMDVLLNSKKSQVGKLVIMYTHHPY